MRLPWSRAAEARRAFEPRGWSVETVALGASLYFCLVANGPAWRDVLTGRTGDDPGTWRFAACFFVGLVALQFVLIALVSTRRTLKATLALLFVIAAAADHYMRSYNVLLDPQMLRNVFATDPKEAGELMTGSFAWHVAWQAGLPIAVLWRLPIRRRPWPRAVLRRVALGVLGLVVCAAAIGAMFQDFSALVRNQREWRWRVTPVNVAVSVVQVAFGGARTVARPLEPIGIDAAPGPRAAARTKPLLMVLVVGETARAANWGLNGYARQTTPELAAIEGVIPFRDATSCGTDTDTSVPCMFSPWGRHDYSRSRIVAHQSLLHLLARARVDVLWRDNQSGCKRVCDGLPFEALDSLTTPGLCADGRCYDEVLLAGLQPWLAAPPDPHGARLLVLHQLGSHGPAYDRRYPDAFRRYTPVCATGELRKCSVDEIVNAYDNTLLYTDHVLAQAIRLLQGLSAQYDTALYYVSDHGESLGEKNLFLHGVPYAIAPSEQTHVPMLMWVSPGFASSTGLDAACLRDRAAQPASHDHLFHTMLGLLDVHTQAYDAAWDLSAACRR